MKAFILIFSFLMMFGKVVGETIWTEDFSTGTKYSVTQGAEGEDGDKDYFIRTDNSAGHNINKSYTGNEGYFFAGQDIDDGGWVGGTSPSQLTWSEIDIEGFTALQFDGKFASTASNKIDATDYIHLEYKIDTGSWTNLIWFENSGGSNTFFLEDTSFNGSGDGVQLTSTFTNFTKNINDTGATLSLRITVSVNAGDEDFAIDNFIISGTASSSSSVLPFTESFDGEEIPVGWTFVDFSVSTTSNAGGSANEAKLAIENTENGSRIQTPAIDTQGQTELTLSWKHNVDSNGTNSVLEVKTSTDGINFNNTVWSETFSTDETELKQIVLGDGSGVGSETLFIQWILTNKTEFNSLNYWYIDDIKFAESEYFDTTITNIEQTPEYPISTNDVVITADVSDVDGIAMTELRWGLSTGALTNVLIMNLTGGETYTADIPAQTNGTEVFYQISARDNSENSNWINSNEYNYTVTDWGFKEDFTNSNATASYGDNSFVGNDDITWTYTESRNGNNDDNSSGIVLPALMLRNTSSIIYSSAIAGGISSFSVKLYKGFTGAGNRQVKLYVNNDLKGTSEAFDDFEEHVFNINDVNTEGNVVIKLENATEKQIIVDDITWNSYNPGSLPVELSSFTANVVEADAQFIALDWTTQSETNVLGYNIYRSESEDVNSAIKLNNTYVYATNTSLEQYYRFEDKEFVFDTTYYYWLESKDLDGTIETFGPVTAKVESEGNQTPGLGELNYLHSNYPNPFNPTTTIKFEMIEAQNVKLEVYNAKGQLVKTIFEGKAQTGANEFKWNGKNNSGNNVASGVYYYRLTSPNYKETKKMMLMK